MIEKRGQIWIETVVYTLIGLALIGLVLAILTPQVREFRDRSTIEQTIDSLNVIDGKISEVLDSPGNRRKIELTLSKGEIYFDGANDIIGYALANSKSMYSEPGVSIQVGRVNVTTYKLTKDYAVYLNMSYKQDVTFDGIDKVEKFGPAKIPYNIFVLNNGTRTIGTPPVSRVQIEVTQG